MRIQVEKFLAVTAMLASAAVMGVGCSSESTDTNNNVAGGGGGGNKGGTGGKDGSTGGAAGSTSGGGTAGGGGSAGGGGAAGGGGTAGAGGACLGDGTTDPDAGVEGGTIDCSTLSYALTSCVDADAGTEGSPLGVDFCYFMATAGRAEVNAELFTCLNAITGDACAAAHDTAVQTCYDGVAAKACQHPNLPDGDGGTYDACADVASSCPAISEAQCDLALNPLNTTKVVAVLNCYDTPVGACEDDFAACIGLP